MQRNTLILMIVIPPLLVAVSKLIPGSSAHPVLTNGLLIIEVVIVGFILAIQERKHIGGEGNETT